MADICKGCGAERKRWKHWYYLYPERIEGAPEPAPIAAWCTTCAPKAVPHLVAERSRRRVAVHRQRRAEMPPLVRLAPTAAMRAAAVHLDEDVTQLDAMARFHVGWRRFRQALAQLRRERAA
jgi:hypothetical protein